MGVKMIGHELLPETNDGLLRFGDPTTRFYGHNWGGVLSLGQSLHWHHTDWESSSEATQRTTTELSRDAVGLLERAAAGILKIYVYKPLNKPSEKVRYVDMGFIVAEPDDHLVMPTSTDEFILLADGPVSDEVATVIAEGIRAEVGLDQLDPNMLPDYSRDAFDVNTPA